jgi:hypothetical protein
MRKLLALLSFCLLIVPSFAFAQDDEEIFTAELEIEGSYPDWLETTVWLNEGDEFTIEADGTVNIWPNCEETKASAGYPDLDCTDVMEITPDGSPAFTGEEEHPIDGVPVAALIARIGENEPFFVGVGGGFVAENSGMLHFALNDYEYWEDNEGEFTISVTTPNPLMLPPLSGSWSETEVTVEAGQTILISVTGTINMWPNCEETRAEQGYPDADCDALQALSADGTDYFGLAEEDYPLPGENVAGLVGRINGGAVFFIGTGGTFEIEESGTLYIAINDTAYWRQDDTESLTIVVEVLEAESTPEATP